MELRFALIVETIIRLDLTRHQIMIATLLLDLWIQTHQILEEVMVEEDHLMVEEDAEEDNLYTFYFRILIILKSQTLNYEKIHSTAHNNNYS